MKSLWRSNLLRAFRAVCATMAVCLVLLTSCSSPPTLESLGGVVLEFSFDDTKGIQPPSKDELARSVNVIRTRLDPTGSKGVTVRLIDENRLEVSLPGTNADERRQAIDLITRLGTLEFAVIANPRDHRLIIESALKNPDDKDEVESDGAVIAVWLNLTFTEPESEAVDFPEFETATRKVQRGENSGVRQYLVIRDLDDERVTGQFLSKVGVGLDEQGRACINLAFDKEGAHRVTLLTRRYSPAADGYRRRLAIVFDGRIHSAPNIIGAMSDRCQITGYFSREELENLVAALSSGVLKIPLNPTPVSERVVGPK